MNVTLRNTAMKIQSPELENGGGGGTNGTPVKSEVTNAEGSKSGDQGAESTGDIDDYGYEIPKEKSAGDKAAEGKAGDESKQDKAAESTKLADATGYEADVKAPEVVVPPVVEEEIKLDYEIKTEGVDPNDAKQLKAFAKEHGLTQKQAQAYLDIRRDESVADKKAYDTAVTTAETKKQETRSGWQKELKADPDFGGDKYAFNVAQVNKLLDDHFPDLKKELTTNKRMLPAYHMKELAKVASLLSRTPKFVDGDAPKPVVEDKEDDGLGFYRS